MYNKYLVFRKTDPTGRFLIHYIYMMAQPRFLKYLIENEYEARYDAGFDGNPATHLCLTMAGFPDHRADCWECLQLLIGKVEVDLNAPDRLGRSLFHLAAQHGLVDLQ